MISKILEITIPFVAADREEAFDWFVMEIFHVEPQEDGSVVLTPMPSFWKV